MTILCMCSCTVLRILYFGLSNLCPLVGALILKIAALTKLHILTLFQAIGVQTYNYTEALIFSCTEETTGSEALSLVLHQFYVVVFLIHTTVFS